MTLNRTRFHIGRLARETGRSVHTIRWYEKQGLMPGVTRDPGGRRVYITQHIGWLLFLDRLRVRRDDGARDASLRQPRRPGQEDPSPATGAARSAPHPHGGAHIAELQAALRFVERKQAYYLKWLTDDRRPGDFVVSAPTQAQVAPRAGLEPATNGLTVRRSTTELPGNRWVKSKARDFA